MDRLNACAERFIRSIKEECLDRMIKIRDLQAKLATAVVVDDTKPAGMVFIGATVRLRNVNTGDEDLYRLVGERPIAA